MTFDRNNQHGVIASFSNMNGVRCCSVSNDGTVCGTTRANVQAWLSNRAVRL